MTWTITKTQNEAAWLEDYIADVLAHPLPFLPPHDYRIGHVEVHWHQVTPGRAYVAANPEQGTPEDRRFARYLLLAQLAPHGYEPAVYTLSFSKTAQWASPKVMDSAKRLVQTGAVRLRRNGDDVVVADVTGDGTDNNGKPDNHQVELHKSYPGSGKLTGMFCDCAWGQFLNTPRTRQWKNFQYTPCKHIIATYWASQSVPIDESRAPGNQGGPGQMSLFDMSGGQPGGSPVMQQPGAPPSPGMSQMAPQNALAPAGSPTEGLFGQPPGQAPAPEDILPQFPMDPSLQPQVNPASVPGGRPGPTPTNPMQYPGGTFSSVRISQEQYQNGDLVRLNQATMGQYEGRPESGMAGQPVDIPAGSVGEVRGTHSSTGMVQVLFMGKQFNEMTYFQPFGASAWCWPSEISPSPNKPPGPAIRRLY